MKFVKNILWFLSISYMAVLVLLSSVAYWPKDVWWLANVIQIMPTWILGLPLLFLIGMAVLIKDIKLFIFQLAGFVILLVGVMSWQIQLPSTRLVSDLPHVRILSVNMGPATQSLDLQKLIQERQPDIIAFQECTAANFEILKKILPQDWALNVEGGAGLALASRFPIIETEAKGREPFGLWGNFVRRYALKSPSGMINLFNVHLETPREGIEALMEKKLSGIQEMKVVTKQQGVESFLASEWISKFNNVVIVGDFNIQAKNPIYRHYWSDWMNAFSRAGNGFGYTKHTRWYGVRIDHVLMDKNWKVVNFSVGPDVGSDHHPIIADIVPLAGNRQVIQSDSSVNPQAQLLTQQSQSAPDLLSAQPSQQVQIPSQSQEVVKEPKAPRVFVALPKKDVYKQGEFPIFVARISDKTERKVWVSTGIPFAPGQLMDEKMFSILDEERNEIAIAAKVLARWPEDQSIRSVLVQFSYPISKKLKKMFFRWGTARALKDLEIVEPEWDYPEAYILMPPQWLCDSKVIGEQVPFGVKQFRSFDAKIEENYQRLRDVPWANDVGHDDYYDTPHTYYQFFIRSGLLAYFLDARKELLHYRDTLILHEGPDRGMAKSGAQTRYVYIEALADDYLLTGDSRSLKVAGYMREYLKKKFQPSKAFYSKNSKNFWTEREPAFPLLGILIYYELTQDPEDLEWSKEVFDNLYKTQLEWPDRGGFIHNLYAHDPEEGCKSNEYGGSPFMAGFLLEAIIKYHQVTGDPKAADSIFRAVDWMINESMVSAKDTFRYLTCSAYEPEDGAPDLNLAIVHAYGYAYRLSGYRESSYLELAQRILNKGVRDGWMGDRKHFNQQFRSSGHYLAYIFDAIAKPKAAPLENADGAVAQEEGGSSEKPVAIIGQHYANSFSATLPQEYLNLDRFQNLDFKYRVQPGEVLGVKVETHFGDWLCLGGTKAFVCDGIFVVRPILLIDDGDWHDVSFNIKNLVRTRLPSTKFVDTIRFQYDSSLGDGFDMDQIEIK